jgi:hypothetical protein
MQITAAKATTFVRKGQQVSMVAVFTFHPDKTIAQVAAVEIPIDDLLQIRPPETLPPGEMVIINLDNGFMSSLCKIIYVLSIMYFKGRCVYWLFGTWLFRTILLAIYLGFPRTGQRRARLRLDPPMISMPIVVSRSARWPKAIQPSSVAQTNWT